ncbi:hypothetical protein [Mycoplasma sp. SG1]|uniref:hypothetical protein n=1 Tax=Mycoplasma sp. SG1 TaxID=2810348 RepID=UPI002025AEB3|nr:hypothetical protein [Mycoplasma sp. SG1]URM53011.1 hypothetical protein JRW51_01545 [Mycoplasma sp. SG1]
MINFIFSGTVDPVQLAIYIPATIIFFILCLVFLWLAWKRNEFERRIPPEHKWRKKEGFFKKQLSLFYGIITCLFLLITITFIVALATNNFDFKSNWTDLIYLV